MKKNLFAVFAATILFASCANDGNNGINNEDGPQAGMSVSFTLPSALETRAETGAEITGTSDESKFTTMKVFIFKSNGTAAKGNGAECVPGDFDIVGNTYTLKAEKQIKTTAGEKNIYIGINLPAGFDSFSTEQEMKSAKAFIAADMVNSSNGAAMMSDVITHTLVTQEDGNTINPANKVSANLERMVAKVAANTTAVNGKFVSTITTNNISVNYTVLKWSIGQCTNLMYPSKQLDANGNLVTPRNADDTPAVVTGAPTDVIAITNGSAAWNDMSSIYVGENAPESKLKGESTYAMVQATFSPNKVASISGSDVVWNSHSFNAGDDIYVVRAAGITYFCKDLTDASAVYYKLDETNSSVTIQNYQGGYVYFVVWLNRNITGEELIVERNQFIHVEITGVKDNQFGGIPGDKEDPTGVTPPDPFEPTEPTEPEPFDPKDPVFETDAYLNVSISVKPWIYAKNTTVLE